MSLFLRTTALMLLMLSRAPAFAAIPVAAPNNTFSGDIDAGDNERLDLVTVKAWPNPTKTYFTVRLNTPDEINLVQIQVFDMSNKLVHAGKFEADLDYTFGDDLEAGVYIVKIVQDKTIKSVRLVKY